MKLKKAPLIMVLAQVRFTPVLKMVDYVPNIQEGLRKNEFPHYLPETIQEVTLGPKVEGVPSVRTLQRWIFGSVDGRHAVILTDDFLVLETSGYEDFPTFMKQFEEIVGIVQQVVKPQLIIRVGLRYVDFIERSGNISSRSLLVEGLRGLSPKEIEGVKSTQSSCVSFCETDYGQLSIRALQLVNAPCIPPELASSKL